MRGVGGKDFPSELGLPAWGRENLRAVRLHHDLSVGLLVVTRRHHEYPAFQPEQHACICKRRSPLSGSSFRGKRFHSFFRVVISLRYGGVGLVRTARVQTLVLEIDFRRSLEFFLQPPSSEQRRRPAHPQQRLSNFFGNGDKPFG